ncbi:Bacteriophytochrome cph2 [Thiorhodovibrio winogradskyi]|uniref:Bacteriophytochrome cph2 n=1 Tax=Thiorhodovibrio winogradskyi TaxID=77007 RepID=A0ABZ0SJ62_9GAMM|nr:EAL domain-containing protein [Thiorhodovibrio winogradskyi]
MGKLNRLSTRYALYFAASLTLILSITLLLAGFFHYSGTQELRRELQQSFSSVHSASVHATLRASGRYLSNRLFNPLFDLDISRLNEEIEQIHAWLDPEAVQILDADKRVLTDGTKNNPDYGAQVELPLDVRPGEPVIETASDASIMVFAIGHDDCLHGYARIRFSDAKDRALLASMQQKVDELWQDSARQLLLTTFIAVGLMVLASVLIGWRLSQSLSRPLRAMSEAAEQVAAGRRQLDLSGGKDDELGRLAHSLNDMAASLGKADHLLTRAQEIAAFGSWEWRRDRPALILSHGVWRILGLDPGAVDASVIGLLERFESKDRARVRAIIQGGSGATAEIEVRVRRADGETRTLILKGEPSLDAGGQPRSCIGTLQDVTEQQEARQQLMLLANYDNLTRLPNRHLFYDLLRQAIKKAHRQGHQVALLFLDLDRFKAVNDALGHAVGDKLLEQVARRLKSAVRDGDTLARMGGDEFTLILDALVDKTAIHKTAERIIASFERPFAIAQRELFISVSMGIALFPGDGDSSEMLLKNADSAMYAAKERGKGCFHFFTQELDRLAHERFVIEHALRQAIERREFALHYQPQVRTQDGQVVGLEALLRWHRPDAPDSSPAAFVPILEDTGMITQLTAGVLRESCNALLELQQRGFHHLRMAINLSARQFQDPRLPAMIDAELSRSGLSPERLEMEITESTLLDHDQSQRNADALAERHIRLAIDDFGTGYSSLSYLKRLDVDILKIDRSFVDHLLDDPDDAQIVTTVLALARGLHIESIAEGVENADQFERLRQLGCDLVQGYFVARPLPLSVLLDWMRARPSAP